MKDSSVHKLNLNIPLKFYTRNKNESLRLKLLKNHLKLKLRICQYDWKKLKPMPLSVENELSVNLKQEYVKF